MTQSSEDQLLVTQIQAGNHEAYEAVFLNYYDGLLGYATTYLKSEDMAEEVVQELFYSFWKKRASLELQTSLSSYLYRAVRNACLNHIKHEKVRQAYQSHGKREYEASAHQFNDPVLALELAAQIEKAIEQLPDARRQIFVMNRYEGLKYREIAEKLGLSIKTVEAQMSKALSTLREHLSEFMLLILSLGLDYFEIF